MKAVASQIEIGGNHFRQKRKIVRFVRLLRRRLWLLRTSSLLAFLAVRRLNQRPALIDVRQVFAESLPVGGTGKVMKNQLRETYAGHYTTRARGAADS